MKMGKASSMDMMKSMLGCGHPDGMNIKGLSERPTGGDSNHTKEHFKKSQAPTYRLGDLSASDLLNIPGSQFFHLKCGVNTLLLTFWVLEDEMRKNTNELKCCSLVDKAEDQRNPPRIRGGLVIDREHQNDSHSCSRCSFNYPSPKVEGQSCPSLLPA
jgi:hypothetical protein